MRVMFVCTGNTCRSPMAESILLYRLKQRNIIDIFVESGGICVNMGDKMAINAQKALETLGIPFEKNRPAHQISQNDIDKADKIICMTSSHKHLLPALDKIISIGEINGCKDLPDPYGQNEEVYMTVANYILQIADIIIEYIKK